MKLSVYFAIFLLAFNISLFGQDKSFAFKGQVHAYGETLKGAKVEVYHGGDLVFETVTKGGGKFDFELKAERQYMVEVSMENFRTKAIWINTKRTKDLKNKVPPFAFDVVLKKEKITRFDELSEIPVTLIKYQPKTKEFYMDKSYEQAVKNKKETIKQNTIKVK